MEIESNQFLKIIRVVALMQDFHQIVQDQESKLELLPFRIGKLLPEKAEETYRRIQKKYESPNGLAIQPQIWLESQKRLFAWFIAFYAYINRDEAGNFPIINFSQLAPSLFHKNPDFLQFHFLALIKNSEKISWDQQKEKLLLSEMNGQGMKWNEISRRVFMKTGKNVFLHPKSCRERWLNHLDGTKLKGNWEIAEDFAIFSHVVETQSKRWSKMVSLLGNKRSQNSIKNRFNTLVAKHRRYKSEKQLKIAARVLTNLQTKIEMLAQANGKNQEQSHQRRILIQFSFEQQQEIQSEELNCENIENLKNSHLSEIRVAKPLASENCNDAQRCDEIMVKQEPAQQVIIPENVGSQVRESPIDGFYPFENYSYEQDMCRYASHIFDFHQTQLFIYQQIFTISIPTADTITRESKILEQRRRQKQTNNPHK